MYFLSGNQDHSAPETIYMNNEHAETPITVFCWSLLRKTLYMHFWPLVCDKQLHQNNANSAPLCIMQTDLLVSLFIEVVGGNFRKVMHLDAWRFWGKKATHPIHSQETACHPKCTQRHYISTEAIVARWK